MKTKTKSKNIKYIILILILFSIKNVLKLVKVYEFNDISNTSYPTIKKSKSNFEDIQLKDFQDDITFHLVSYCWMTKYRLYG